MKLAYIKETREKNRPAVALVRGDGTYLAVAPLLRAWMELSGLAMPVWGSLLSMAGQPTRLADVVGRAEETLAAEGRLGEFLYPADSPLLPPLPRPNRILAIGRNYAEHAKEQGAAVHEEPIVFLKASTSVIGPGGAIEIPQWLGRVDYEAELLAIIGKGGKNIPEAEAMTHIVGYSIFNDVTAREQQRADQARKHPWFRSKSLDTFGPLGPYVVTADAIGDPHCLRISLTVNGETRQDDTTASMVYKLPELIAFLSKWFALEPGDVIATGTPSGIGPLVPGDTVETSIENIGALRNPVVSV